MKKIISITLIMLIVLTSFNFAIAQENTYTPNAVVESGYGTFLSWGAITTTHYYCNPGDIYGGIISYINGTGTMRIQIYKVGSSTPIATYTAVGPLNDDIGEGGSVTIATAGYYYVKFTNISSNSLDVSYAVVYN